MTNMAAVVCLHKILSLTLYKFLPCHKKSIHLLLLPPKQSCKIRKMIPIILASMSNLEFCVLKSIFLDNKSLWLGRLRAWITLST